MVKNSIIITMKTPDRIRWGLFFYVNSCVLCGHRTISEAISDYKELYKIDTEPEALTVDYYRLLELHRKCLQHGI